MELERKKERERETYLRKFGKIIWYGYDSLMRCLAQDQGLTKIGVRVLKQFVVVTKNHLLHLARRKELKDFIN